VDGKTEGVVEAGEEGGLVKVGAADIIKEGAEADEEEADEVAVETAEE